MTKRPEIRELPGKAEHGGYVYVLEFTSGLVKPGRTQDPRSRLGDHAKSARLFGAELADWWVSPLHDGWKGNEESLIAFASDLGGVPLTPEWLSVRLRNLHAQVKYGARTKEEAASIVAELLIRDEPEFARVIVERWAAGKFARLLKADPLPSWWDAAEDRGQRGSEHPG